ncbi:hypothetical protein H257_09294 [Aphanomyces astaci]|uniref:DDE Tnp4 domain-containing protein n=1 Tax=Aphanomyces astaci TaxID=112090 RepID=W4GD16_APHAT|nr:hypothetical protein H257_09294 [Aphanomyces astaci]ETV76858.1 hypothetical protein H257_09294 [Aphanomyces astaci]|eukprot:XP_009833770.1 hypothetical protein H257_09294 [Aphanomyces astaci]
MYNGHKRKHAIKFQSVVTPDGLISHGFGPGEGRRHDLTLLRKSCLENVIASNPRFQVYIIYKDPAYGRSDQLVSPFSGGRLTEAQNHVNASISRVRVSIEWSYGQILQYWPIVDLKKKVKLGSDPRCRPADKLCYLCPPAYSMRDISRRSSTSMSSIHAMNPVLPEPQHWGSKEFVFRCLR